MIGLTAVIAVGGLVSAAIFGGQLYIMRGQLDEMRDEQRPWVYADIGIAGKPYRTQSNGVAFRIGFMVHNVGHLPAFYVSPDLESFLFGIDAQSSEGAIRPRQKKLCDTPLQQPAARDQLGGTVFPGQASPFSGIVSISEAEIESIKRKWSNSGLIPIIPWGVGCIRYKAPDGGNHQTGFAFSIGMANPGQVGMRVLPLDPTTVDPSQLIIAPWVEGGTAYAN